MIILNILVLVLYINLHDPKRTGVEEKKWGLLKSGCGLSPPPLVVIRDSNINDCQRRDAKLQVHSVYCCNDTGNGGSLYSENTLSVGISIAPVENF